jgi:hypothetical protein
MDTKILIDIVLKQLNIPNEKLYSKWINSYFCSILNGTNIYFDSLNETKDNNLTKIKRDFKREIESAEKFNLGLLKSKQETANKEYELILTKFEQDLKANTNETVIQNELKLNLKQFYENLFVKTCLFVVNKSNDDFKLIVLNMGTDIKDFNLKNIIKSLLK